MTDRPEMSRQDREMVRRALEARRAPDVGPPGDGALDDMALAAYLDGTLTEAARERIEAALTASAEAAEFWHAARESLEAPMTAAPEAAIRRAQALVTGAPAGRRSGVGIRLSGLAEAFAPSLGGLPRPLGAALAALALVVVSAGGFELGRAGYGNLMGAAQQVDSDDDFGFGEPADEIL